MFILISVINLNTILLILILKFIIIFKKFRCFIRQDTRLINLAEKAGKNEDIQDEINLMIEKLMLGNENCGRGKKTLFRNVKELRGNQGGPVYYRKADGKIEILGKSDKVERNQQKVINILKDLY